ncbi:MAG TPA: GGDEF domain-containing protein [Spirochaetota bacterium]|nr:GGDEF domain-containing protein [Spirochaetota bacterium]
MLSEKWKKRIKEVDFAFQPIVNPLTGLTFAVEALLRNTDKIGFENISDFFDEAYDERQIFLLDLELREKAIKKFCNIDFYKKIKLFYNYDPRILEMNEYRLGETESILTKYDLEKDQICFEINEKYRVNSIKSLKFFINKLKERGIYIALDDFGSGFAGFELFYHSEPNFLKFDRFLISEINNDIKKKSFCAHIINLCKILNVTVIGEGVENEKEFLTCKELGFDLIQGYFIQKPTKEVADLKYFFDDIKELEQKNKRKKSNDSYLIFKEIIKLDTISVNDGVKILFEKFHDKLSYNFFPVIDTTGYPLGIIREKDTKQYVYSPYGKDLLLNKSMNKSLNKFITICPTLDIKTPQDKILEVFVNNPESEGIIITENTKYVGFLNAKSLLNILNEKNITYARETNPLTKLPGNILINQYILDSFEENEYYYYFIYFDFDNFKPFNDKFGFRQGDRAITLFADILKKSYDKEDFIGHIGGDDFFVGVKKKENAKTEIIVEIKKLIDKFTDGISSFYSKEEFVRGFYSSVDRSGIRKRFALLSVSSAIIEISKNSNNITQDDISLKLAELKKEAKRSRERISFFSL